MLFCLLAFMRGGVTAPAQLRTPPNGPKSSESLSTMSTATPVRLSCWRLSWRRGVCFLFHALSEDLSGAAAIPQKGGDWEVVPTVSSVVSLVVSFDVCRARLIARCLGMGQ